MHNLKSPCCTSLTTVGSTLVLTESSGSCSTIDLSDGIDERIEAAKLNLGINELETDDKHNLIFRLTNGNVVKINLYENLQNVIEDAVRNVITKMSQED